MTRLAIPSKELALKIVGPADAIFASRVQRLNINTDIPVTVVDELGSSTHAGTITDTPNITLTFSAFDVGIRTFATLTGQDPNSYPGAGVDIDQLGEVDAIVYVKDATASDYVKSAHARRLQVRDFTFNYSVDGESSEDYTAIGSEKRWFSNDVAVERFTTGTTLFVLTTDGGAIQLKNGEWLMSVILDGVYLDEVTGTPGTGEYSFNDGTETITTGDTRSDQLIAVFHANPSGNNWSDVSDEIQPAAIRGRDVTVTIGASGIERVQSVTINGNLNPQPVSEMGNRVIVGYQRQVPTVEGTITVLDTDVELVRLLSNSEGGDTEFLIGDEACTVSGVPLEIKLYDPCLSALSGLLKTVYIPQLRIVGDALTSNVNDNVTQTFNFQSATAECFVYSGARP